MDPLIGSALIGAGASIFGGILGSNGQAAANRANLKMMREQMAWQEKMWNMTNEYNSPSAQLARMQQAGLNPLSQQLGNSPAQNMSAPSGSPMQNTLSPYQSALDSIGNIASNYQQQRLINSQVQAQENENNTYMTSFLVQINKMRAETRELLSRKDLNDVDRKKAEKDLEWYDTIQEHTLANLDSATNVNNIKVVDLANQIHTRQQEINLKTQEFLLNKWKAHQEIRIADVQLSIQKALAQSNIKLNSQQEKLLKQQVLTEIENTKFVKSKTKNTDAQTENINVQTESYKIDNKQKEWNLEKDKLFINGPSDLNELNQFIGITVDKFGGQLLSLAGKL